MTRLGRIGISLVSLGLAAGGAIAEGKDGAGGADLGWFGRSSTRIRTQSGFVLYIDPYAKGDYSAPADLVLVTHGHSDHNQVKLVTRKAGSTVLAPPGALPASTKDYREVAEGQVVKVGPVTVTILPASNRNHHRGECVGYLVAFDGIVVYHAGDTSRLPEMASWKGYGITYALLPCDGFYNMGPDEASACAADMGAKRVIPIHSSADGLYGADNAKALRGKEVVLLAPGASTPLRP